MAKFNPLRRRTTRTTPAAAAAGDGNVDGIIGALADAQWGVVARRQLVAGGVTAGAIEHRLRAGRLRPLHRGVYAVGHVALDRRAHALAAVLACGGKAVLSHDSAAALLRMTDRWPAEHVVTVPDHGGRRRPGIAIHAVRRLDPRDVTMVDGIRVTAPARTLLDLAETLPLDRLQRVLGEAQVQRLVTLADLRDQMARSPGRRGLAPLAALLDDGLAQPTRSELEARFQRLIRDARLPVPEFNTAVERLEVDAVWRDRRVVVELDGWRFHRSRDAFERDRDRQRRLAAAGYRVIRVTHRQLLHDRLALAADLARALAA
ncbi:MAG TPA: DUF559 domain-containing protein [Solirubrobacteraceae bacterium]|nr:DUF559 domain-containing protein [Solirubrobacteraceae bacterium]